MTSLDEHLPYLHAMARRLIGNPHDASDLVQDALVRALRALPPAGDDLRPWLATILRHLFVDRLRQRARAPFPVPLDEVDLSAADPEAPDAIDHLDHLDEAIAGLPEPFRRVFVLHQLEGRSYRDIADALGIPLATVGTRLTRARLKLREHLLRCGTPMHR